MPVYQYTKSQPSFDAGSQNGELIDQVDSYLLSIGVAPQSKSLNGDVFTITTDIALTLPQDAQIATIVADFEYVDSLNIQSNALNQAENIPDWARWTEAHFLTWFQTNVQDVIDTHDAQIDLVSNIAQVRTALHALLDDNQRSATMLQNAIRFIIALRNDTWPKMQEPE